MRALGLVVAIACVSMAAFADSAPVTPRPRDPSQSPATPAAGPFKIVPAHARLGPGEAVRFKVVPAGQADAAVGWRVEGRGVARDGVYRAPYVIATPGERATVIASRGSRSAPEFDQALVELVAGVFPGVEDCLGPGQQWEPNGCTLAYVPVDELPEAVTKVPPRYPPSARARKLEGSFLVQVVVCRSGRVLDAVALSGVGGTRIPELEDLAVEAAKQWGFKPGLVQGQPVATVVAIPFRFPPP